MNGLLTCTAYNIEFDWLCWLTNKFSSFSLLVAVSSDGILFNFVRNLNFNNFIGLKVGLYEQ